MFSLNRIKVSTIASESRLPWLVMLFLCFLIRHQATYKGPFVYCWLPPRVCQLCLTPMLTEWCRTVTMSQESHNHMTSTLTEALLYARHLLMLIFIPATALWGRTIIIPHFTDEETETQKGYVTYIRQVAELGVWIQVVCPQNPCSQPPSYATSQMF